MDSFISFLWRLDSYFLLVFIGLYLLIRCLIFISHVYDVVGIVFSSLSNHERSSGHALFHITPSPLIVFHSDSFRLASKAPLL
jgi:hypothetical protein